MARIVVGVDGSDNAAAALSWAIAEAGIRDDAVVEVVMAWHEPVAASGTVPTMVMIDLDELESAYREQLDQVVADVRRDHPEVTIEATLARGPAARALLDASGDADLLVVGSRGRGGFMGLLLGSVSQQAVQHAPCPVVVVPEPRT